MRNCLLQVFLSSIIPAAFAQDDVQKTLLQNEPLKEVSSLANCHNAVCYNLMILPREN